MSAHEECAVELAGPAVAADGGEATVLTLGDADAVGAAAHRAGGRLHGRHPRAWPTPQRVRPGRRRPRDRRGRPRPRGGGHAATTWSCSATTPPTAATSRSASGWPTSSAGRSSTAPRRCRSRVGATATVVVARGAGPGGAGDLPGAAARRGDDPRGRRRAALPVGPGPDEGQEGRRSRSASRSAEPIGPARVRLTLPPPTPSAVQILGEGPAAAPAVVDLLEKLGVLSR